MDEEEDDFYASNEAQSQPLQNAPLEGNPTTGQNNENNENNNDQPDNDEDQPMMEDLEEGEEEEEVEVEESDSDIDIITDRKDVAAPDPSTLPSRHNVIRNPPPARVPSLDTARQATPQGKSDPSPKAATSTGKTGADYPAVRTSTIDVDQVPTYKPVGKSITEIDIDEDLKEHEKPWRLPGTDVSDYFNYGFDEFTWALYCLKQEKMRAQVQQDKKEFTSGMMGDGAAFGMPGLPPLTVNGAQPGMNLPAVPDIPAEMQNMMAQMMASGVDPSQMPQMDLSMFGMQQGATSQSGGANGSQAQGFGNAQQGFGPQGQNQQQMGFGFDPSVMAADAGRNRQGNFAGRGRGANRRGW